MDGEADIGTDQPPEEEVVDGELVDVMPIVAEPSDVLAPRSWATPPVRTAVVAATGFIAGAATLALLTRRGNRSRELDRARIEELAQIGRGDSAAPASAYRGGTYLVSIRPLQPPR